MIFTIANILTISRLFLAPVFLVCMLVNEYWATVVGSGIFAVAAITDWFDGYLARKFKEETEQGIFLDPLADKVLTTSAFIVFWMWDVMQLWMVLVIVVRDFGITVVRSIGANTSKPLTTSLLAKTKTFVQMVYISCVLCWTMVVGSSGHRGWWIVVGSYVVVGLTLASAVEYAIRWKR
jgi:CDP-diacylglycerol---glycerol-3-phosphate 3-phosphatidyltransferase